MSIEVNNESAIDIDEAVLQRMAAYTLDAMKVHPDAELAVVLVDEAAMEQLHVQWMDEPGPTDVLSFPMDELRPGTVDAVTPAGLLGDVVICPQVAQAQAEASGHATIDEIKLLLTHGILHLLGFDHAEPADEKEMFGLQRDILLSFSTTERGGGSMAGVAPEPTTGDPVPTRSSGKHGGSASATDSSATDAGDAPE
ncbi:putative rRNA maturation factor [Lysinibacter cavernae]|uniref:Endoribonuclease YbeY n=1 Tax=Lysinibacter cavernae TaxID=1640652 RepID=A0A7X5R054_9MICO|nr:putative rRNA maturation factor [Lysinibacter cavernae]